MRGDATDDDKARRFQVAQPGTAALSNPSAHTDTDTVTQHVSASMGVERVGK